MIKVQFFFSVFLIIVAIFLFLYTCQCAMKKTKFSEKFDSSCKDSETEIISNLRDLITKGNSLINMSNPSKYEVVNYITGAEYVLKNCTDLDDHMGDKKLFTSTSDRLKLCSLLSEFADKRRKVFAKHVDQNNLIG